MSRETAIFGRHLSASVCRYARDKVPDLSFPAMLSESDELATLEYFAPAELTVVKVAYDTADRDRLGALHDHNGTAFISVCTLAALPFAALVVGPGQPVYLTPVVTNAGPDLDYSSALIARARPGASNRDTFHGKEEWARFDAAVAAWLPGVPHESENEDGSVMISIGQAGQKPTEELEQALRTAARAAYHQIKEARDGR